MAMHESDRMLEELIQGYLEGGLSPQEADLLKEILMINPEVVERLLEGLRTDLLLKETVRSVEESSLSGKSDLPSELMTLIKEYQAGQEILSLSKDTDEEEVRRIKAFAERQLQSFMAEQERLEKQRKRQNRPKRRIRLTIDFSTVGEAIDKFVNTMTRVTVATVICAVLALLSLIPIQYYMKNRVVARLRQESNAVWAEEPSDYNLKPGKMALEEGVAKLVFTSGAEVILQAPCTFELKTPKKMFLEEGSVTAKVPKSAIGFTVDTLFNRVKDFGTEFGVALENGQDTQVHVYEGHVRLTSESNVQKKRTVHDLKKGQVATATEVGVAFGKIDDQAMRFIRSMPNPNRVFGIPGKTLDLADVVGGGNGFGTGRLGRCIDPITGQVYEFSSHITRTGQGAFVSVPHLPFVDGVFTLNADGGLTKVSSSSHLFSFPKNGGGWWTEVCNSGFVNQEKSDPNQMVLDGQVYGTILHPAILLHSNLGITFDLQAIRATLGDTQIAGFSSTCGLSNNVPKVKNADAVFYVLVDGQIRFQEHIQLDNKTSSKIQVGLSDRDQYLTLVCTEGLRNEGDWSLFGDVVLELKQ